MATVKDMTTGNPTKLIVGFAIPMIFGNLFQQLYSMVDSIVVGRGVGVEALASVGAASYLDWLVLGILMGITQGFSILISQRFGAGDAMGLRKALTMAVLSALGLMVVMSVIAQLLTRPLLELLRTPENTIDGACLYIRIIFAGIPIIVTYNLLSAILRALGNSRTPLIAMIIAALINVALDLLFVMQLGWGIAGVAIATVIAQVCSCLVCLKALLGIDLIRPEKQDWKPDFKVIGDLFRLGIPVAFQNGIIAAGGLIMQYVINGFGFIFVAGITAGNKLYGLLEQAGVSVGNAVATYAGQNLGAGKLKRIRLGVRRASMVSIGISLVIMALMFLLGRAIMMLYVSGDAATTGQVVDVGVQYLRVMSIMLPILYMLFIYRSALQGMGNTVIPMYSGIVELIMRVCMALLLSYWLGQNGIYFAEVSAWLGAEVLLMISYYRSMRKLEDKACLDT